MTSFKAPFTIEDQDGEEVELEVWGYYQPAEPGVGIFEPEVTFDCAEDPAKERGVELEPEQKARAVDALWSEWERRKEKHAADLADEYSRRKDERGLEMLREARR